MIKKSIFRVLTAITLILAMNINAEAQLAPRKPAPAPANTLTISETKVTLAEGATKTLTVSGLAAGERARWTSSNSGVATVDANGKIAAVKAGTATITAASTSAKVTCEVTVTAKPAAELTLNKTSISLEVGKTETLTVSGLAAGETVSWKSKYSSNATVDANGKIAAVKAGKTTITATAGTRTATCEVTVTAGGLTISETSISLVEGATKTLKIVSGLEPGETVSWKTDYNPVATVNASGTVTAGEEGTATITAIAGYKTAKCKITVTAKPVTELKLNKTSITLEEGKTETLTVSGLEPGEKVSWAGNIYASVSDNGKITAEREGTATITATAGSRKATCTVTVTPQKMFFNETSISMVEGATKTLTVTGLATGQTSKWTSSNSDVVTVIGIGKVAAVKAGTAKITATAGTKTATCTVTVTSGKLTLSATTLSLTKGQNKKITVNSGLAAGEKPTWKSSSTSVATIDSEGNIVAKDNGKTTITATVNGKEGKCDVSVYTPITKTHLGQGINIYGAETFASKYIKSQNPIIDINKMLADNPARVMQNKDIASDVIFTIATGKSVSDVVNSLNSKNNVSYKGAFSVSADANYNTKKTESRTSMFAKVKGQVIVMKEWITSPTAASLKSYLTTGFTNAVKNVNNVADAKKMMENYGTHVIVKCDWGGVVDMDILYTSSKITSTSELEIAIKGSVSGFSASSNNTSTSNRDNFKENNNASIICRGGNESIPNTIEEFEKTYKPWVASIKSGTNTVACGIDDASCLIPLSDIVAAMPDYASKATYFKTAIDQMQQNATTILGNIKIGIPVLTDLVTREHTGGATELQNIPTGFNHAVLNDLFDMGNSKTNFENPSTAEKILFISQFSPSKTKGVSHMFYKTQYLTECVSGGAIAQISVYADLKNRPNTYNDWPSYKSKGWVDPGINLNAKCDSDNPTKMWLIYKKATPSDTYVIDFIGGIRYTQKPSDALPADNSDGVWDWLKWEQDRKGGDRNLDVTKGEIANIDLQCGNDYSIRIAIHYVKKATAEAANKN